jgi:hypothetical protein
MNYKNLLKILNDCPEWIAGTIEGQGVENWLAFPSATPEQLQRTLEWCISQEKYETCILIKQILDEISTNTNR